MMGKLWQDCPVIVTGGAGFVGSHLVERLINAGAQVTVIDNLSRGRAENLAAVRDRISLQELALSKEGFNCPANSVVFHLAAKVTGIQYNRFHHLDMLQTNLAINWHVTEAIRESKPVRYIYVSTACVYPYDAPVPTPESAGRVGNPEPTNHGYGVAKWVGEQQAIHLCQELGVSTAIVRFFNAFGARDYYDDATSHVVPALIKRALRGDNPLVVWGTGQQTRALVDVRDIAKALLIVAERITDARPVNIGHDREVSIAELACTIMRLCGRPEAQIQFDRSKPDGYPRRAAETSLLRSITGGWVPDTPLEVTLKDMIADFKSRFPNEVARS